MPKQVQCPNCGGFKTNIDRIRKANPATRREYANIRDFGWIIVIICAGLFSGLLMFNNIGSQDGSSIKGMGIFIILLALVGLFFIFYLIRRRKDAVNKYYFHCTICGYQWNRLETEPEPPVTIRPDLIQKGDEELKKQQAGAAAAYYEQQRRNK
jgi:hypothetical protein